MAGIIYGLCALTSLGCFLLLWRSWSKGGHRLLFWSALCFALLTVNNVLLVVDKIVFPEPDFDLRLWRLGMGFAAVMLLVIGLVWEED